MWHGPLGWTEIEHAKWWRVVKDGTGVYITGIGIGLHLITKPLSTRELKNIIERHYGLTAEPESVMKAMRVTVEQAVNDTMMTAEWKNAPNEEIRTKLILAAAGEAGFQYAREYRHRVGAGKAARLDLKRAMNRAVMNGELTVFDYTA